MRVLVVGAHRSNNLEDFACAAFLREGHEVSFLGYSEYSPISTELWAKVSTRILGPSFPRAVDFALGRFQTAVVDRVSQSAPELILVIKGEGVSPSTIAAIRKRVPAPLALWFPDDPRFFATFVKWVAPKYDVVFTYARRALGRYRSLGVDRTFCLPFGCDPTVHRPFPEEFHRNGGPDVVFVGTYTTRRGRLVRDLEREGFHLEIYGPHWPRWGSNLNRHPAVYGQEMARLCSRAKITLNAFTSPGWGPNMRVFETTGSGGFLLTEDCGDMELYFRPERELAVFRDSKEMCQKARYYLRHSDERVEIARSGFLRAQKDHTYDARVREIIQDACRGQENPS